LSRTAASSTRHRPPGVSVEITEYTPNAELHNDHLLAAAFRANAESLGRRRESHPRIQAELKYLKTEFMRRTLRDPQQIGSMIRMARHPAVGLFLDQPPVKVPYGTDLGQVSQARNNRDRRSRRPTLPEASAITRMAAMATIKEPGSNVKYSSQPRSATDVGSSLPVPKKPVPRKAMR
jgi:hypothetical protein